MLDLSKYEFGPYPKKPIRPTPSNHGDSIYYHDLAKKFEVYELNLLKYEAEAELWKDRQKAITAQFKEDCFDYFKLRNNLCGEKIYKLAISLGDGDNFCFEDISNILETICDILES